MEVRENEEAQQLSLVLTNRQDVKFSPHALSDGTLRFLAYAVMLEDYRPGLLCIEEPENGLHPDKIPALLSLLLDIAMDTNYPVEADNPLRQVIISTHSPMVVSNVPDDALLYVHPTLHGRGHQRAEIAYFQWLPDTWRASLASTPSRIVARGDILKYANPIRGTSDEEQNRVVDNPYIHYLLDNSSTADAERGK